MVPKVTFTSYYLDENIDSALSNSVNANQVYMANSISQKISKRLFIIRKLVTAPINILKLLPLRSL